MSYAARNGLLSLFAIGAVISIAASPLAAQDQPLPPPIPLDSRVRVSTSDGQAAEYVGALSSRNEESLSISRPGYELQTIPLSDLVEMEISRGRSGNWLKGGMIGLGVGLVGGVIAAAFAVDAAEEEDNPFAPLAWFFFPAAGTVAGGALGAGAGALVRTEKWETVPLPESGETGPEVVAGYR